MSCQRNALLISQFIIFAFLCSKSSCQPWVWLKDDASEPVWNKLDIPKFEGTKQPETDPKDEDLQPDILEKILGQKLDPRYMSLTPPWGTNKPQKQYLNDTEMTDNFSRMELVHSMPEELKNLDFRMPGLGKSLGLRASRKLRLWLWKLSFCPVIERWKDFGIRFWPRYINVGECAQKETCSFPSGMNCKANNGTKIPILWWYCREIKYNSISCSWLRFEWPILTECKCSC